MFEQTFVDTGVQPRKPAAVAASVIFQSAAVGALLLIPLVHVEMLPLPRPEDPKIWMIQMQPPAPPPPETVIRRVRREPGPNLLLAPTHVPDRTPVFVDEPSPSIGMPDLSAVAASVIGVLLPAVAPPPPPPPVKPVQITKPPRIVTVSKGVQAAKLIFGPRPEYPALAKAARVQGVVHLQAIIGADGNVRNLSALSGPPLLIGAAISAVSRWRYQPTLLTDVPVEVTTLIDVNFTLNQ